jgi:hypothetical protein
MTRARARRASTCQDSAAWPVPEPRVVSTSMVGLPSGVGGLLVGGVAQALKLEGAVFDVEVAGQALLQPIEQGG